MHQILFQLGCAPDPAVGAIALPQILCLDFRGPTSKGRVGKGMRWEERGKEVGRRGRGETETFPSPNDATDH